MNTARRVRIACLALILPLTLGACRDEKDSAAETPAESTAAAPAQAVEPAPARPVEPAPVAQAPATAPPCVDCGTVTDVRSYQVKGDASGVGAAVGAVAGGLLGNQIGGGSGKKIATVAGVVGGGLAGHEIEKRRNTDTRWEVTVQLDNGGTTTVPYSQAPGLTVGQKVRVVNGQVVPM
ncbi:MAG TPA: glycine zipper 2TM domain-containing protein [Immundisolibacter sp.]|nr:glycine zipper 2TM domain-containing protein [Immundisolibacter sp.]